LPLLGLFAPLRVPWWLTGGWAIDLAAGYLSRPHNGIDVFMAARDAPALSRELVGVSFDLVDASGGAIPWRPDLRQLEMSDRLFVASPTLPLRSQIAFGVCDGDGWVFPSDRAIRASLADATTERFAIPLLTPRIVLFNRAFSFRGQDQADFETAYPLLQTDDKAWLADAIRRRLHH
jgi:hypothetical protein